MVKKKITKQNKLNIDPKMNHNKINSITNKQKTKQLFLVIF